MDVMTNCLQVSTGANTSPLFGGIVNQIPCVANASGGTPSSAMAFYTGALPDNVLIAGLDSSVVMHAVRRILMGATAASFLIVSGSEKVDARHHAVEQWAPTQPTEHRSNSELRVDRLITLKSATGASNSDLARMLRISRTQLYKWMSSDQALEMEAGNWKRLSDLAQIAKEWNRLSARPMRAFLHEKVDGARSLLSLLASAQLDISKIRSLVAKYAKFESRIGMSREENLRLKGVRSRPPGGASNWDE